MQIWLFVDISDRWQPVHGVPHPYSFLKSSYQTCGVFLVTFRGICKVAQPKSPAVKLMQDSCSNFILMSVSTGTVP